MIVRRKVGSLALLFIFLLWLFCDTKLGPQDLRLDMDRQTWQDRVAAKQRDTMAKIPQDWLLSDTILSEGKKQTKIAGKFIEDLLDPETRGITGRDSDEILELIATGSLSALEVILAFCKRAAYAHQLVSKSVSAFQDSL